MLFGAKISRRADTRFDEGVYPQDSLVQHTRQKLVKILEIFPRSVLQDAERPCGDAGKSDRAEAGVGLEDGSRSGLAKRQR